MNISRIVRVNELLRREIGEAIFRIVRDDQMDLAALTVTHIVTSRDLRHARVFVSIREHRGERDRMLAVLRENRARIQQMINRDLTLKYTPRLSFALDESIEKGDDLLHLLAKLEAETQTDADKPGAGEPDTHEAGTEA